jgi:hypothetical protein
MDGDGNIGQREDQLDTNLDVNNALDTIPHNLLSYH